MSNFAIMDASMFKRKLRSEIQQAVTNSKINLKFLLAKGNKLEQELKDACLEKYVEYKTSGRFHYICENSVKKKCDRLKKIGSLRSNDHHIIALAIVACANTLITHEKETLIYDFKHIKSINTSIGCLPNNQLKGTGHQKVIRKNSPGKKRVMEILRGAEAKGKRCECIANGGGCS